MNASAVKLALRWLLAVAAAAGLSCADATVDSHMNTVAELAYLADADGDDWQSPEQTVTRGGGDCEDLALLLQRLLRRDGIASTVVFGVRDAKRPKTGHAWVECVLHDELCVLDPTCRLVARRSSLPWHMYYRVPDQPDLTKRLREYLARTGDKNVNLEYEAAMARPAEAAGPGTLSETTRLAE